MKSEEMSGVRRIIWIKCIPRKSAYVAMVYKRLSSKTFQRCSMDSNATRPSFDHRDS